ncbi:hypothetical protein [Brevundimonas sp.]|uniref:hypothetical protein n=1 Tax=Brevundimonas sp. TaxID=1871086 RepID=UPI0028B25EA2|nr:hypothetical protein [Brevundimonas sp.]
MHHLDIHARQLVVGLVAELPGQGGGEPHHHPARPASSVERRKQAMRQMHRDGLSNGQTAKVLGVHRRTVELCHQVDRRLGLAFKEQNTLDLFED